MTDYYWIRIRGREEGPYDLQTLRLMVADGEVRSSTLVREERGDWFPLEELGGVNSDRDWLVAVLLSGFLGSSASIASTWATPALASSSW